MLFVQTKEFYILLIRKVTKIDVWSKTIDIPKTKINGVFFQRKNIWLKKGTAIATINNLYKYRQSHVKLKHYYLPISTL